MQQLHGFGEFGAKKALTELCILQKPENQMTNFCANCVVEYRGT